jgi:hypothetical protein
MSPLPILAGSNAPHGAVMPIAKIVADGSTLTFTFNNIPQNYQDLMLVSYTRSNASGTADYVKSTYNNDSGTNYSQTELDGYGSGSGYSGRSTNGTSGCLGGTMPTSNNAPYLYSSHVSHILNYANASAYKTNITRTACEENGGSYSLVTIYAGLYRSISAITRIDLSLFNGTAYSAGSTFTLYGVRSIGQ